MRTALSVDCPLGEFPKGGHMFIGGKMKSKMSIIYRIERSF